MQYPTGCCSRPIIVTGGNVSDTWKKSTVIYHSVRLKRTRNQSTTFRKLVNHQLTTATPHQKRQIVFIDIFCSEARACILAVSKL